MAIIISDIGDGIKVSEIMRRVARLASDAGHVTWERSELYDWINDAGHAVVKLRPDARALSADIELTEGVRHTLESQRAIQLLDIVRNKPGAAIRVVDRRLLEDSDPQWYDTTPASSLLHYCVDERQPREFLVYPPAAAGVQIEAVYSEAPPRIGAEGDVIELHEQYRDPLVNYVMYRMLSKDAEEGLPATAAAYYQTFAASLGVAQESA